MLVYDRIERIDVNKTSGSSAYYLLLLVLS